MQSHTGAEQLMRQAACGEKAVIPWRWGNYMKRQMQTGGDSVTSHHPGTAPCRRTLIHTLKCLKVSQMQWWEIWDVLQPGSGLE